MSLPICPHCKKEMRVVKGKFGDFYGCVMYPKCKFTSKTRYFAGNRAIKLRDKDVLPGSFESNFK